MEFTDLTPETIAKIKALYYDDNITWNEKIEHLMELFGRSERTTRRWLKKLNITKEDKTDSEHYIKAKKNIIQKRKRYFITWAQNNTPVHKPFLQNLKTYAGYMDAEIIIIAGRYKNPTSVFTDKYYEYWVNETLPYLDARRHNIHKGVMVLSDVKIQPTAVNPMTGLTGLSKENQSCIFGHPKLQMEMLPTLDENIPKMICTSGACTIKNYTDSKAGKKGEFHHVIGFTIVEIEDNDTAHVRQVSAENNGNFYDLMNYIKDNKVKHDEKAIKGCVLGDIHLGNNDEKLLEKNYEILNKFQPEHVVLHDVFDGYSISHHEMKDPVKRYHKYVSGKVSLKKEIDKMKAWLSIMEKYNPVIVKSNHDTFIDRWVINTDWKMNIENAVEYMKYTKALLEGVADKGLIPYIIDNEPNLTNIKTLGTDESYRIMEWECGMHGDLGTNGSRGNINQYRKFNTKMIVGHHHSPSRKDGVLSVGTSTNLRMGYNNGPSNWVNGHVIIQSNGKAQHIVLRKNKKKQYMHTL